MRFGVLVIAAFLVALAFGVIVWTASFGPPREFEPTGCSFRGRVVDAGTRSAIVGATISGLGSSSSDGGPPDSFVVRSGLAGEWSVAVVDCRVAYSLDASAKGYLPQSRTLVADPVGEWDFELARDD